MSMNSMSKAYLNHSDCSQLLDLMSGPNHDHKAIRDFASKFNGSTALLLFNNPINFVHHNTGCQECKAILIEFGAKLEDIKEYTSFNLRRKFIDDQDIYKPVSQQANLIESSFSSSNLPMRIFPRQLVIDDGEVYKSVSQHDHKAIIAFAETYKESNEVMTTHLKLACLTQCIDCMTIFMERGADYKKVLKDMYGLDLDSPLPVESSVLDFEPPVPLDFNSTA